MSVACGAAAGALGVYALMRLKNQKNKTFNYREIAFPGGVIEFENVEKLFEGKSAFQKIEIYSSPVFGKYLVMDSQIQSAIADEFIYHESLVQPAMLCHPNPKRVYIGGGGEGATLREVLRHKSVTECVMVDIDPLAVEMCRQHGPEWSAGAFEDPRTKLVGDDAKKILMEYDDGYFDVIIMDLCDPLDYGPCYKLYSKEFYELCHRKLAKGGVFVTQSGPASALVMKDVWTPVYRTLASSQFEHVFAYRANVPTFVMDWGFNIAIKSDGAPSQAMLNIASLDVLDPKGVDETIATREGLASALRHYNGSAHNSMFALTKYHQQHFEEDQRVISENNPIYVTHIKAGESAQ